MERELQIYHTYMKTHPPCPVVTATPLAHLCMYDGTLQDSQLIAFSVENIKQEFDNESPLVVNLLKQLTTYDCTKQYITGIAFDKKIVITDVFKVP